MNQNNNFMKNKRPFLSLVFLVILLTIIISFRQSVGQNKPTSVYAAQNLETQNRENPEDTAQGEQLSVWNIIQMTDWLFWPFVLLTTVGLFLLSYRSLQEYQEKNRAQEFYIQLAHERDMNTLVKSIQNSLPNRASLLIHLMIRTFNKTGHAEPIANDVDQFLNSERDSFKTFNRIMDFLSDSAGALGLLGTVWGIFVTFHGGKMDGPTILQGMSIALITTLVGLIISLMLNMGTTAVFAFFNGQINQLSTRAKEVRQVLLNLEKKTQFNGKRNSEPTRRRTNKSQIIQVSEEQLINDDNEKS